MNIKIDAADREFSIYIRLRDEVCQRCRRPGWPDAKGRPIKGLQASHYFGRGRESTRFDPDNVIALCMGCHQYWGSTNREDYREYMIKRLGEKGFNDLSTRARMLVKKDRKAALIAAKQLVKELTKE